MSATFIEAYQQARLRMDELKQAARRSSPTTVMSAFIAGKPVIVTKRVKLGGEFYGPGAQFVADPNLLNRYEILANQGYFTTSEQWALNREYHASKSQAEHLDEVFKKWDRAATASQAARARLAQAEAELSAAKGNIQNTAQELEKAEAEGMEVFAKLRKN